MTSSSWTWTQGQVLWLNWPAQVNICWLQGAHCWFGLCLLRNCVLKGEERSISVPSRWRGKDDHWKSILPTDHHYRWTSGEYTSSDLMCAHIPIASYAWVSPILINIACNDANAIPTRSRYAGTVRRHDRWIIWMGGAGRSGDGLRMVSKVSVGGAGRSGNGLRIVSRVSP